MRRPETRTTTRDGAELAYQVWGEGDLDLVLVPGVFSHLELSWGDPAWARFARALGSFARVVTYDKRGTGLSGPLTALPTHAERVADLVAVMDAAGVLRPAAVLGISDGAGLAAVLAALRPERVAALVLYAGNPGGPPGPGRPWALSDAHWERLETAVAAWGSGSTLPLFAPSIATDVQRRLWSLVEKASITPDVLRLLWRSVRETDLSPALEAVRAPTLVLHRRDDLVPLAGSERIAQLVPGARLVVLDGADHLPWVADSSPLYDEVARFLTSQPAGRTEDVVVATVLFTDVVDSTGHLLHDGDAGWRRRRDEHDRIVRDELARAGGREVDTAGDGFFAVFSDPVGAATCAAAVVRRVREAGLEVRAGVHTGECRVDGLAVSGLTVHVGARVMSAAGPGEVLLSAPSADLVRAAGLAVTDRGEHRLKGLPSPLALFAMADRPAALLPEQRATPTPGRMDSLSLRLVARAPGLSRAGLRLVRPAAGR